MKKGLKEFQKIYDLVCESHSLALDLAQNLNFKLKMAKPKYAKISEDDVHIAYGLTGMGKKYELNLMEVVHELAEKLGFTREDYIENRNERQNNSNCNIYIAGKGSINCDTGDILDV